MGVSEWADELARWAEQAQARVGAALEPTVRLGVTGLARAGKTVFIASLVANLLRRGRMGGLRAEADGRILGAMLSPPPDMEAPRFDYEAHLADLFAPAPRWPESTRSISQLRVSLRYRPSGTLSRLAGDGVLHLDLVDYPGEWLLDLPLMTKSFRQWSDEALALADRRPEGAALAAWARAADPSAPFDEAVAQAGAAAHAAFLDALRRNGLSGPGPGRFLLPGDLEGAPAVTFAPLPPSEAAAAADRASLAAECARRYEGYKRVVAKPFFRDHFARLDRQVVLVDALTAISRGPAAVADLKTSLTEILAAFRPGAASWLGRLLGPALTGRRVDRLLLAVSKADHIHHSAHPDLTALVRDLLAQTIDRAAYAGAEAEALAIASLRATVETEIRQSGAAWPAVRGRRLSDRRDATLFPGAPPRSLAELSAEGWDLGDFQSTAFAPPVLERREGEGPPHLRLDQAAEFLIGDRLA